MKATIGRADLRDLKLEAMVARREALGDELIEQGTLARENAENRDHALAQGWKRDADLYEYRRAKAQVRYDLTKELYDAVDGKVRAHLRRWG